MENFSNWSEETRNSQHSWDRLEKPKLGQSRTGAIRLQS